MTDYLDQPLADVTFCAFDVETTGLNPAQNRVIEIGMVKVKNGEVIDRFGSLVNPGCLIPPFITQLTGIDDDEVEDAPSFDEIARDVMAFFEGTVVVGHNLQFDMGFIRHEFFRSGIEHFQPLQVCTLKIARRLFPQLKSRSLGPLAYHLHLRTEQLHRALDDAELTAKVLGKEIGILETSNITNLKELIDYQFTPAAKTAFEVKKPKIVNGIAAVPDSPGVYYFMNKRKQIVYIGKAKSLRKRLRSYITPSAKGKTKKIIKSADTLKVQQTPTELSACLLEAELIKLIDPKLNIQLKSYRDKYFLKIDNSKRFPSVEITKDFLFDGNDYFGLFINKRKADEIFNLINRIFSLRECSDKEFNKRKSCFLHEIERCTAPCENDDLNLYAAEMKNVFDFMAGKNQFALDRLLLKMKKFADELRFEKAQEVKELVQLVLAQIQKSSLLEEPVNKANVLFEVAHSLQRVDYLLLLQGKVYINNYLINSDRNFFSALNDYYEGSLSNDLSPDQEDLEKLKTTLNWVIRNRHQVTVYYLRNYRNISELERSIQRPVREEKNLAEITITAEDFIGEKLD